MKIDLIGGARPNFVKIAPLIDALDKYNKKNLSYKNLSYRLVHTGQHYDHAMSDSFFEDLGIPQPDVNLEVGPGSHAEQTGLIMQRYEKLLISQPADLCLVVGDVTSTMACAITAKKLYLKVAHVEAGIRSGDITMPEEINRLVTDSISDFFFTTTQLASDTLIREGHSSDNIFLVGNTMIDTLLKQMSRFKKPDFYDILNLQPKGYLVLTLHRPANVDTISKLKHFFEKILEGADNIPIIFPAHPRTINVMRKNGLQPNGVYTVDPMSYLEFNYLVKYAIGVITDSGGITEETTVMGVPCITLRNSTERPETCTIGTNELIGTNPNNIPKFILKIKEGKWKKGKIPDLWDGKTSERVIKNLVKKFNW